MSPRKRNKILKQELEEQYGMSLEDIYKLLGKTRSFSAVNKELGLTRRSFTKYMKYCLRNAKDVEPVFSNTTLEEERNLIIGVIVKNRRMLSIKKREEFELIRKGNEFKLVKPKPYPVEYYLIKLEERFGGRKNLIEFCKGYTDRFVQLCVIARELWIPHQHKTAEVLWRLGFQEYVELRGSLHIENWNPHYNRPKIGSKKKIVRNQSNAPMEAVIIDKPPKFNKEDETTKQKPKEYSKEEYTNLLNSLMSVNFINSFNCKKFGLRKLRDNLNTENNILNRIKQEKVA